MMERAIRIRVLTAAAAALAAAVPLLAGAIPAQASALPNDDISNATVITSMPVHQVADMTQATWDPSTDDGSCNSWYHAQSVWYQFTPAASGQVEFDPTSSNQPMVIDVYTGTPGALSFLSCGSGGGGDAGNPQGELLNATAGTTYWIMVSPICCVSNPNLDLWIYPAAVPQVTLGPVSGTVDKAGNAELSGTLTCAGVIPSPITISGSIQQPIGRKSSVTGTFTTTITCGAAQTWQALAQPATGKFAGGSATVTIPAFYVCNGVGCITPSQTTVIRLNG
jgi:hypothetical protein